MILQFLFVSFLCGKYACNNIGSIYQGVVHSEKIEHMPFHVIN